jgi:hypothetical protein
MGLSDDQRAMLRLLAQRGEQGYEDIAALKGLSVDEVRAQVAQALAQLDEEGALSASPPAAEPDPPKRAPEPPSAPEVTPKSEPAPTPEPAPAPPKARKPRPSKRTPKLSLPSGSGLRAAIAAGVGVIALIAIILIVSGGGDDESTAGSTPTAEATTGTSEQAANNAAANPNGVTKAVLKPVAGGDAEGVAIFGKVDEGKKESLALEVAIEGLEPSAAGTSYTIWLSQSPQRMLPLVSTSVEKTGKIAGQFKVPVEVLAYLANETFKDLVVTQTTDATLEASLKKATDEKNAPTYTGTEVLRGTVTGPVVGAQIRQEELEKAKGEAE